MAEPSGARIVDAPATESRTESRVRRDLGRFGSATILAAAIGAVQLFVIPRRLDVATYGAYRIFLVYVGYLGLLHLGLADGAFLRWVGQSPTAIRREWHSVLRWIVALHAAIMAVALVVGAMTGDATVRTYAIAFAGFAAAANVSTLGAYALQAAGDFKGASLVAVIPPAAFVMLVVFVPMHSLGATCAAYIGGYALAAVVGATRVRRLELAPHSLPHGAPLEARALVREGLPVLGANFTAGLSQFADRILVSVSVPMTSFAMYGFASSVMVASSAATQALSRVALSHAGKRSLEGRSGFVWRFHDLIAVGFALALAGVPAFERLVQLLVPAYDEALPIVRALVIGAPFWVAIHVVLVGTLQACGRVRRQFALELAGLALVAAGAGTALLAGAPLWGVAGAATGAAALTWLGGTWFVERSVAAHGLGRWRFLLTVVTQSAALIAALQLSDAWMVQTALYLALALPISWASWRATRRWRA